MRRVVKIVHNLLKKLKKYLQKPNSKYKFAITKRDKSRFLCFTEKKQNLHFLTKLLFLISNSYNYEEDFYSYVGDCMRCAYSRIVYH